MQQQQGALSGVTVVDLTRVLAGPYCTQLLGDLGADVIKIERPGKGDDTRGFAPPFVRDGDGNVTSESAYFMSANRNKRSVAVDLTKPEGQALVRRLVGKADVLVENFKTGNLAKYGLGYDDLKDEHPGLVYCSITGFGQTGPYASRPGYDFLVQGMGGIMSITGEPDGEPQKVGVPIADIMAGMFAAVAVNAALRHAAVTGKGQYIDIGMLDTQVAWLVNQGMNFLHSGKAERLGNAHPNIVPYQVFPTADGHIVLAIGNDTQFRTFCTFAGVPELADDPMFATNASRVANRDQHAGPGVHRPARDRARDGQAGAAPAGGTRGRVHHREPAQALGHAGHLSPSSAAAGRADRRGAARGARDGRRGAGEPARVGNDLIGAARRARR